MPEAPPTPTKRTLAELALALHAELRPASAAAVVVYAVAAIPQATAQDLVFAEDLPSLSAAQASAAAAVLVSPSHAHGPEAALPLLLVDQPKLAFARAALLLRAAPAATGIHPTAVVAPSARLAAGVSVGPLAVIGEDTELGAGVSIGAGAILGARCVLGFGCQVYPRAVLYPGVRLGCRVVVHAGAVLGSDGFGYVRDAATGEYLQFPQQGQLILEDDVEVGANSTIDRGALEQTRIGRGTKLDNLVHVGHNVELGAHVVIAAQTGISGSSRIGAGAVIAGQVGIADHVSIGPGAILGAQCGVPSNKRISGPGQLFWGTPARPIAQYLKELATLARLTRQPRTPRSS